MSERGYQFEVALSFAGGDKRDVVRRVAELLQANLGKGKVFFDEWFEVELAGTDSHRVLAKYYGKMTRLVVAFVSKLYCDRPWTQDEWRAIETLERSLRDAGGDNVKRLRFLPLRIGDGEIDNLLSPNAIVPDVRDRTPEEIADLILKRLDLVNKERDGERTEQYDSAAIPVPEESNRKAPAQSSSPQRRPDRNETDSPPSRLARFSHGSPAEPQQPTSRQSGSARRSLLWLCPLGLALLLIGIAALNPRDRTSSQGKPEVSPQDKPEVSPQDKPEVSPQDKPEVSPQDKKDESPQDKQQEALLSISVEQALAPTNELQTLLRTHFESQDKVALDHGRLSRPATAPAECAIANISSGPAVDLCVELDDSWTRVQYFGLVLPANDAERYEFVIQTDASLSAKLPIQDAAGLPSMGACARDGLWASIRRNGTILSRRRVYPHPGFLQLTASRRHELLLFSIASRGSDPNTVKAFDDFPPTTNIESGLSLYWPTLACISKIEVREVSLTKKPNRMEEGDRYYHSKQFERACSCYDQIARSQQSAEARYKRVMCLEHGTEENQQLAFAELQVLASDLKANDKELTPWHHLAWVHLLAARLDEHLKFPADLARIKRLRECIELILDPTGQLDATGEKDVTFAAILPDDLRAKLLDYLGKVGPRWRFALDRGGDLRELRMRLQLAGVLGEEPSKIRKLRWRMADAYRMTGKIEDTDEALKVLQDLLLGDVPSEERVELISDLVWVYLSDPRYGATHAMRCIEPMIESLENGNNVVLAPLLIERARVFYSLHRPDQAEADLLLFFKMVDPAMLTRADFLERVGPLPVSYSRYAEGCAMLGLVYENVESPKIDAHRIWERGLRRYWCERQLEPDVMCKTLGAEMVDAERSLTVNGILMSWAPRCEPDEAKLHVDALMAGDVVGQGALRVFSMLDSAFLASVCTAVYVPAEARELSRSMLVRTCSMRDWYTKVFGPIVFACVETGDLGPLKDVPPKVEQLVYEGCTKLVQDFDFDGPTGKPSAAADRGRLLMSAVDGMLLIWGSYCLPYIPVVGNIYKNSKDGSYKAIKDGVRPEVLPLVQYVFGCRALVRKRGEAKDYFRDAYNDPNCPEEVSADIVRRCPEVLEK